jgi:group I intron endonuclease
MIIYKATNLINGKVYIGQTINTLRYRSEQHRREAKIDDRKHTYFHNAIRKYGFENFEFECIDEAESIDELNEKEAKWIELYHSTDENVGYNLDSGGRNSTKSDRTKRLIGDTTLEKWNNEELRTRMRDGLHKATRTWQSICEERRVTRACPICGREFTVAPWEARRTEYCSRACSNTANLDMRVSYFKKASEVNRARKLTQNEMLSEFIYGWAMDNQELVLSCPKNKISTMLSDLHDLIYSAFGIEDWRTIAESVGVYYKKDFLVHLQNYVRQNIC